MSCWNTGQQGWSEKQDIVTCYLWVCPGIQWGVASFFSFNSSVSGRITWHALFVLPDILIRICLLLRCVRLNATMELEHWCYLENRYCFWNNLFFIHSWTWALDARDGCFPLTVMHFLFCSHCFIIVQLVRPWDPWMLFLDMITPHICFNWLHPSARFFQSFTVASLSSCLGPGGCHFCQWMHHPGMHQFFLLFFGVYYCQAIKIMKKHRHPYNHIFNENPIMVYWRSGVSGRQACLPDGHDWTWGLIGNTGLSSRRTCLTRGGSSGTQACVPDRHDWTWWADREDRPVFPMDIKLRIWPVSLPA